jgi:sec-independent protein translocase protein TatC
VLIVIVAAFITPPDIFSQIALSIPLYMLYEISILLCRNVDKNHSNDESACNEPS